MVNSESKKIYIVGSHMPYDMDDSNIGQIFVLSDWITKDLVSTEDYFIKFAREYFYENYEVPSLKNHIFHLNNFENLFVISLNNDLQLLQ